MACARHQDDVAARRGGHSPALGDQGEDQARGPGARPGRARAAPDGCGRRRICSRGLSQVHCGLFDRAAQPLRAVVEIDEVELEVGRQGEKAAQGGVVVAGAQPCRREVDV